MWRVVRPVSKDVFAAWWWSHDRRTDNALKVVDSLVGKGHIAVDVGAAYGLFTYRLAKLVGPSGGVHSFEPNPDHWPGLKAAGRKPNVTLHTIALSNRPGGAVMHVPSGSSGSPNPGMGTLEPDRVEGQAVEVHLDTLDRLLANLPRIEFVKIDVEGHEHSVLEGAKGLVSRHHPILLMEIEQRHRQRPIEETFELLAGAGYRGVALSGTRGFFELDEFNVERDQLDVIAADPETATPPAEYVNDFVFLPAGRDLPRLG